MKKKFRVIFKWTLLALLIVISVLATIILFPQLLFANKIKYKKFKVCSNAKISDDIKIVLDNAMSLVQKSELYDSTYKYNIILCHNSFYNKIDDRLLGIGPAARARLHNVIIKVKIDPQRNLAFPTFRKECETNLTCLLAHEMIHCLQAKKYGILKFNPFRPPELWKLEGYPEYISKKPGLLSKNYSLTNEIERYVNMENNATDIWILAEEGGCEAPDYYYKGRLMMEYLMDIKHLSYDQILKDSVSESTIFKEMIKWKNSTNEPETVLIPGGKFEMGSNDGDSDEKPIHSVTIDSFFMGKYEVTNVQFCEFLNEKGNQTQDSTQWIKLDGTWDAEKCRIIQDGNHFSVASGFNNYPITFISWNAAVAYCQWLSDKTGKKYRLPTEAEWEFAAGNGTIHTKYSWGNNDPSATKGGNVADEALKKSFPKWDVFSGYNDGFVFNAPVGSFAANDFGLYDMTGNVWEWCSDWKGEYNKDNDLNPTGVLNGKKKVIRGGGWLGSPEASRVVDRYSDTPDHRGHSMGFRVAMTLR